MKGWVFLKEKKTKKLKPKILAEIIVWGATVQWNKDENIKEKQERPSYSLNSVHLYKINYNYENLRKKKIHKIKCVLRNSNSRKDKYNNYIVVVLENLGNCNL